MFAFIAKHRGIWPVALICEALGVSRSGFCGWLTRPPSERTRRHEAMTAAIRKSFLDSDRRMEAVRDLFAATVDEARYDERRRDAPIAFDQRGNVRIVIPDTKVPRADPFHFTCGNDRHPDGRRPQEAGSVARAALAR